MRSVAPGRRVESPLLRRGSVLIGSSDSGKALALPFGSLHAACDAGTANLGAIRDTPRRRDPVAVSGISAMFLPTLRTAGRTYRQRKAVRRCAVRLWKPVQQLLCRMVKMKRSRPDRFRIVSRFRIAARSTLIPTDRPTPDSRALPDRRRRRERAAILAVLKSPTGERRRGCSRSPPGNPAADALMARGLSSHDPTNRARSKSLDYRNSPSF